MQAKRLRKTYEKNLEKSKKKCPREKIKRNLRKKMSERKNLEKSTDKMPREKISKKVRKKCPRKKSKKKRSEKFSKKIKQNKKFPPKNRFLVFFFLHSFFTPTYRSRIQINNRSL